MKEVTDESALSSPTPVYGMAVIRENQQELEKVMRAHLGKHVVFSEAAYN